MQDAILEKLDLIEREHDVSILFAIESGSRAWGFPSVDSDYDVRFVYAHRPEWYLSIFPGRDVIELPVGPVLDINGWDVAKALRLLRKSNVSLMEWISSPIQYRSRDELAAIFRAAVPHGFNPATSARHYLSMAKTNLSKTDRDEVRLKTYLYTIRPLLCCRWLLERGTQPPMNFRELAATYLSGTAVGAVLSRLIALKEDQTEGDTIPRHALLDQFIASQFAELTERCPDEAQLPELPVFDQVFRTILAKI